MIRKYIDSWLVFAALVFAASLRLRLHSRQTLGQSSSIRGSCSPRRCGSASTRNEHSDSRHPFCRPSILYGP